MPRSPKRASSRSLLLAAWAVCFLGGLSSAVSEAAAPAARPSAEEVSTGSKLQEQERVTAVDVLIELDAEVAPTGAVRELPAKLTAESFEVRIEGEARPIVGFFDPRPVGTVPAWKADEPPDEPWRIVLYFDLELAERDTVRWAAGELAELASRLTQLGEVELVIAGDADAGGLAPTRDAALLEGELAGLALRPRGAHRQVEMRAEVLEALRDDAESLQDPEVARALIDQEDALVEDRLDQLLLRLVDRDVPGVKRALFWVTDGFDLEPEAFYASQGIETDDRMPLLLRERTAKLAVTLASYGWVGVALAPPPADAGLVPGFRIGKWLFSRRGTAEALLRGELIFGKFTREARRDPEEARAHYELGRAHLAAGEPEEAEQAFERALYHYAGDPRTRKDQAAAKVGLGRALEAQGAVAEARQAFAHAVELDPNLAGALPEARPRLFEPLAFPASLADSTAGRLVETADELAEAVASLSRRARLTYQISGVPRGDVRKLEVSLAGSELDLRYPSWTRSGTPSGVAAARARRLPLGEYDDGDLAIRARLDSGGADDRSVVVNVDLESLADSPERGAPVLLRITTATGAPGAVQDVRSQRFEALPDADDAGLSYRLPIAPAIEDGWVSVVVEDLDTGRWGADLVD